MRQDALPASHSTSRYGWVLCAVLLAIAAQPEAYAQAEARAQVPPRFAAFDVADGLASGHVRALHQDRQGFLWIGTYGGLSRYDGASFTSYLHDPADPASLPDNQVNDLAEDAGGLWVATAGGLARYDPAMATFTRYVHDPADPASLPHDGVKAVAVDAAGAVWVGTERGLGRIDPQAAAVERIPLGTTPDAGLGIPPEEGESGAGRPAGRGEATVYALWPEPDGTMWIGSSAGLYRYAAAEGLRHVEPGAVPSRVRGGERAGRRLSVYALHRDRAGALWVGTVWNGLYRFDPAHEAWTRYAADPLNPQSLGQEWVLSIAEDADGTLWVGTDGGGLHRYDPATDTFARFVHDPDDPSSLSDDRVLALFQDRSQVLWVGTSKGLNRRYPLSTFVAHWNHRRGGLRSGDVTAFVEDAGGTLWVGTDGGGLHRYDEASGTFTVYRHDPADPESLGDDQVMALAADEGGAVWVGTYGGLYRRDPATGAFAHVRPELPPGATPTLLTTPDLAYAEGHLWAATFGGLVRVDTETLRATRYAHDPEDPASLSQNFTTSVALGAGGAVWVGTYSAGLNRFDPATETFTLYRHDPLDPHTISADYVSTLHAGRDGALWVGTDDGLSRLARGPEGTQAEPRVTRYHRDDGLPSPLVQGVLGDEAGRLWVTTENGLAILDLQAGTAYTYDQRDGLQGHAFNEGAVYHSPRTGRFYLGGGNGYNALQPARLQPEPPPGPVVLTGLRLVGESTGASDAGARLGRALAKAEPLELRHDDRVVTAEFAALDFAAPHRHRYAVRLSGLQDDWLDVGAQREATFAGLPPGRYTLELRAAGRSGAWREAEQSLELVILSPWWRSAGAYVLYVLLLTGAGLGLVRYRLSRRRLRHRLERERMAAEQLRALDRAKSRFFANVSHEFRTPLTLTVGPLDDLLGGLHGSLPDPVEEQLRLVRRNARRLLGLINELLDVARLESGRLTLQRVPRDLTAFVRHVASAYAALAERQGLDLRLELPEGPLPGHIDAYQLEKAVGNLLSNALKFTPRGGRVTVRLRAQGSEGDGHGTWAVLEVEDTGPGIPEEDLPYVFDRFYQVSETRTTLQPGTGIGLALARELAELHGGTLTVASEVATGAGSGTTFTLRLPLAEAEPEAPTGWGRWLEARAEARVEVLEDHLTAAPEEPPEVTAFDAESARDDVTTVLVVEDNADVRAYLARHLAADYRVLEAPDGQAGLEAAQAHLPDLVIADVMMPRLSGIELCRALKSDPATDFIPVLLLTARADVEDRLEALREHADDYVTKPFDVRAVRARAANLIASRRQWRTRLAEVPVEAPALTGDDLFGQRVLEVIEQHAAEADFDVSALAGALGMDRSQLYRRLEHLDESPAELIWSVRLEQAARLLAGGLGTVSEVAYGTGFKSVSHFSRRFRQRYGVTPSAYAAGERG